MKSILVLFLAVLAQPVFGQSAATDIGTSESVGPIVRGAVCDDPGIITSDDGTAENGYSGNPDTVTEVRVVDQFDVADFPAGAIDTICVGWISLAGGATLNFDIVIYDDDGAAGAPGTELASIASTAAGIPAGLPGQMYSYDVSGAGITLPAADSFYIGARWAPNGDIFVASDETGATSAGAGQVWFDTDMIWNPINTLFPNYSALMVRALPGTGGGEPPPESTPVPVMGVWSISGLALLMVVVALTVLRRKTA